MNYYYKLFLFTLVSFSFAQKEANKTNDEAEGLSSQKHIQSIDGVAAIVGDKLVLTSDVNQALAMEIFKQKLDPQRDQLKILELKNKIIESIVSRKVVLAMAELDSVEVGEKDVDRALNQQVDNIISQAGSEEAAEKALGQPLRTFKREYWYDVRDMLITQKYQQTLIGRVSINKTGVERFFNAFRDSLPLFPTTVKLRHLLIKINPGEKQINKTTALLLELRTKLLNKKLSFKDAALSYSQDPGSKNTGGSLGFVRRGTLVTAFEAVAFNLKPGEVSLPIKTEFGYHIIETEEIRGDRIKVRHILIAPTTTEEDESLAYTKISALKDSSKSLTDFISTIKNNSMDTKTSKNGGNLGWINPATYPVPEFGLVLGQIEKNVCAGPVRSELGYHLLWVEGVKSGGLANLSLHWTEIEQMALNRKQALWFSNWAQEAKKKVFIHINN